MNKSYITRTFGCRVNEAETTQIARSLAKSGFIEDTINPTYILINSCAITAKAEREVRQYIYQSKKKYPGAEIILTGCAATLTRINNIRIITNDRKQNIAEIINSQPTFGQNSGNPEIVTNQFSRSGRFFIKIQDGCIRRCSYCIVPNVRKQVSHETINDIITTVKTLKKPLSEIILTAVNTEYFGENSEETIMSLVDRLLAETAIPRISFGSINPHSITEKFLNWYNLRVHEPRFVHFFHIPIQSGSDTILSRMRRGYSITNVESNIKIIRKLNPTAYIGTDIIVGYPGETEDDFNDTYEFLKRSEINHFHVFRFSLRANTPAVRDQKILGVVHEKIKRVRSHKLQKLSELKYRNFVNTLKGIQTSVLVLEKTVNSGHQCLLGNQVTGILPNKKYTAGTLLKIIVGQFKDGFLNVYPLK